MIEFAPNIYYIKGENQSRFPYCACLYFKGSNLFYKAYPDFPDLIRWFELVHIEKHLMRLKTMGKVRQEDDKWIKN